MITMAEIARLTGVSQPTVSRVLNGNPNVDAAIRERVLACAKAHDYQPNALAKGMKGSRTYLLGVLMTDISNSFFAELAQQIEAEAKRAGYSIILFNSNYSLEQQQACIDIVRRYRVDGVLAVPLRESSGIWQENVEKLGVPLVLITRRAEGIDSVYVDHAEAGAQVARHLLQRGYDRFLFVGKAYDKKCQGFCQGLAGCQAPFHTFYYESYAQLKRDLAALPLEPEQRLGIFAYNDICALRVLRALHELGIRVPEQAGVAGFDNTFAGECMVPSLTSVHQPLPEMAACAVTQLLSKIEHPEETAALDRCFYGTLVARESS